LILKEKVMSEAELVSNVFSSNELIWSLMQYWASVSMGVLIGSHFVASRLNRIVLASFLVIYISFSVQIWNVIYVQMEVLKGIAMDLRQLADDGISLSNAARRWMETGPTVNNSAWGKLNGGAVFLTMFAATTVYPIYCKRNASGSD
jgi:hypothetical protein